MRLVSWNVNGLRACAEKGFEDSIRSLDPDIVCLQEIKLQPEQMVDVLPGYHRFLNSAEKKGYAGTAVFTRDMPLQVRLGIGIDEHDHEGRVIACEYPRFILVNCYTPNAQRELTRLPYRLRWEDDFRAYLSALDAQKPVVLCGDLNVAHQEIDLKNPRTNHNNAGFTDAERDKFTKLLDAGFTDSFRYFHPDQTGAYSWWSYIRAARSTNAGWRIDYFVVSNKIADAMRGATIHSDVLGSDHCPVSLDLAD